MLRTFLTALLILGMVFQPYAVARSAQMGGRGMNQSTVSMSDGMNDTHEVMQMAEEGDEQPCHINADEADDECNDCCETDCPMGEHCLGAAAPVANLVLTFYFWIHHDVQSNPVFILSHKDGLPGFIDLPPIIS